MGEKKGGENMKKLAKKHNVVKESIQAYAYCMCNACGCSCNSQTNAASSKYGSNTSVYRARKN